MVSAVTRIPCPRRVFGEPAPAAADFQDVVAGPGAHLVEHRARISASCAASRLSCPVLEIGRGIGHAVVQPFAVEVVAQVVMVRRCCSAPGRGSWPSARTAASRRRAPAPCRGSRRKDRRRPHGPGRGRPAGPAWSSRRRGRPRRSRDRPRGSDGRRGRGRGHAIPPPVPARRPGAEAAAVRQHEVQPPAPPSSAPWRRRGRNSAAGRTGPSVVVRTGMGRSPDTARSGKDRDLPRNGKQSACAAAGRGARRSEMAAAVSLRPRLMP